MGMCFFIKVLKFTEIDGIESERLVVDGLELESWSDVHRFYDMLPYDTIMEVDDNNRNITVMGHMDPDHLVDPLIWYKYL